MVLKDVPSKFESHCTREKVFKYTSIKLQQNQPKQKKYYNFA